MAVFSSKFVYGAIPLAAIILLGVAFFVTQYLHARTERALLQSALAPFVIPPVADGGVLYTVTDSGLEPEPSLRTSVRVLRTAYVSVMTRRDPLLGFAGIDVSTWETNINALEQSIRELRPSLAAQDDEHLADVLHPIEALREARRLEESRQTVINTPDEQAIRRYHTQLIKTIDAYLSYITRCKAALTGEAPKDDVRFEAWGGAISIARYLEALSQLEVRLGEVRQAAERRDACARRFSASCINALEKEPRVVAPPTPLGNHIAPPDARIREHKHILDGVHDPTGVAPQVPIVALSYAACYPNEHPVYYYRWPITESHYAGAVRTESLNDIYFFIFTPDESLGGYRKYLQDNGILFDYQAIGNYYLCPDARDVQMVSTLYAVDEVLRRTPIAAQTDRSLGTQERALLHTTPLTDTALYDYLRALQDELSGMGERTFEQTYGDASVMRAQQLFDMWNFRTARLDEQLVTMAYYNNELIPLFAAQKITPWYLLAVRSYLSYLLPVSNSSVVGDTPLSLITDPKPYDVSAAHMQTYRDGIFAARTPDELIALIRQNRARIEAAHQKLAPRY